MNCRLLIFEGIMGAGKSSATRRFAARIAASGLGADAFTEGADPHPVRASDDLAHFFEPWRDVSGAQLACRVGQKWEKFVGARSQSRRVAVMDGQLFHGDLTHLFMMDVPPPEIQRHVRRLMNILEPLRPLVIYFFQDDLERAIRTVCDERGEQWVDYQLAWKLNSPYATRRGLRGIPGLASLYRDYRSLTDGLFGELECGKLAIETSSRDWTAYDAQIAEVLAASDLPI